MLSVAVLSAEFILKESYAWLVQCFQKNNFIELPKKKIKNVL